MFISQSLTAKKNDRRTSGASITFSQRYKKRIQTGYISFRIKESVMETAGFDYGDRLEVFYNPDDKAWKLKKTERGSTISGHQASRKGSITYTMKDGHADLSNGEEYELIKATCDEHSIEFGLNEITFSLLDPVRTV